VKNGFKKDMIDNARSRVAQLRRLIPDSHELRKVLRHNATQSDEVEHASAPIDHEIAKLEYVPQGGRECPPCWRCKWFDGFLPGTHKPLRMPLTDPELRAAVLDTEARKINIAERVRAGTWRERGEA